MSFWVIRHRMYPSLFIILWQHTSGCIFRSIRLYHYWPFMITMWNVQHRCKSNLQLLQTQIVVRLPMEMVHPSSSTLWMAPLIRDTHKYSTDNNCKTWEIVLHRTDSVIWNSMSAPPGSNFSLCQLYTHPLIFTLSIWSASDTSQCLYAVRISLPSNEAQLWGGIL